jgi:hypothetical protein
MVECLGWNNCNILGAETFGWSNQEVWGGRGM